MDETEDEEMQLALAMWVLCPRPALRPGSCVDESAIVSQVDVAGSSKRERSGGQRGASSSGRGPRCASVCEPRGLSRFLRGFLRRCLHLLRCLTAQVRRCSRTPVSCSPSWARCPASIPTTHASGRFWILSPAKRRRGRKRRSEAPSGSGQHPTHSQSTFREAPIANLLRR